VSKRNNSTKRRRQVELMKVKNIYKMLGIAGPIGPMPQVYNGIECVVSHFKSCLPKFVQRIYLISLPTVSIFTWKEVIYDDSEWHDTNAFPIKIFCIMHRRLSCSCKNLYILHMCLDPDEGIAIAMGGRRQPNTWQYNPHSWCVRICAKEAMKKKIDEFSVYHIHEA